MAGWGKAATLAEARGAFASIEDNGDEWFSNLLASDDELARWISKGQVSIATTPTTAMLLRQRYGYQRLYFANVKREKLAGDVKTCLAGRQEKIITTVLDWEGEGAPIKEALQAGGFSRYALLKRAVKINEPKAPENVAADYAKAADLPQIEKIIRRYFDPWLDHWPDKDEIETAIREQRVIVARLPMTEQIIAICSFQRIGQTVYERYLASKEEYRGQKYGVRLLQTLFNLLHIALPSGRFCGREWPRSGASGHVH